MRRIICATNMPYVEEAFRTLGAPSIIEGRAIGPQHVRDAELLALRSTTRVDRALLEGSRVRFVGTATIGVDHLDTDYLDRAGIRWCNAAGCNANSVAEYIVAGLLQVAHNHGLTLRGRTLGIIGVGHVGTRVAAKARALGLRVLLNDPPRARDWDAREGDSPFVTLEALLSASDIVTLHVPLTRTGADRTLHLADTSFFERLKPGALFINAARGAVTDSAALIAALASGRVGHAILDTWEGEPDYRVDVMERVDMATPHIAGHSFEGRVMGTVMVYRAACRFLGVPADWRVDELLPPPVKPRLDPQVAGREPQDVLHELVRAVYPIAEDDRRFRATAAYPSAERITAFDRLRKDYPVRREFRFTQVGLPPGEQALRATVAALGFRLAGEEGAAALEE